MPLFSLTYQGIDTHSHSHSHKDTQKPMQILENVNFLRAWTMFTSSLSTYWHMVSTLYLNTFLSNVKFIKLYE